MRFVDGGLVGDIYLSDTAEADDVAVFLPGFPAFVGPNAVTTELITGGYLACQPHYFGSYDSSGPHSPNSLVDTCRATDQMFRKGQVSMGKEGRIQELPSRARLWVGHSFGCLVALRAVKFLSTVETLILLAPAVHYGQDPDFGVREDGLKHFEYVKASHPYTYRLAAKDQWIDVLTGKDTLPKNDDHKSLRRVVAIVGNRDEYLDKDALGRNLQLIVGAYCGSSVRLDFHVVASDHSLDNLVSAMKFDGLCNYFVSK